MFGFLFGLTAMVIGLVFRLSFAFGLLIVKVAFVIGKSLFKILAGMSRGIGRLAAKGFKALIAAHKCRKGDKAKNDSRMEAVWLEMREGGVL